MPHKFEGVCPVVNVPFLPDLSIDYEGLRSIIDFTLDAGCDTISLFAFNSEPHKMAWNEKFDVIRAFLDHVDHRAETIVGIIENSISGSVEMAQWVEKFGGDGMILYPPSLSTPQNKKLLGYFKSVADSVGISVMIQDNPRSTGVTMTTDFLLSAYREIQNFRYLKVECPIPVRKLKDLVRLTEGDLKTYTGNGGIFAVDGFLNGAWGIMPGVVTAGSFVKIFNACKAGQIDKARDIFENILPLVWYEDQSLEFYIACEKVLLKKRGVIEHPLLREPGCDLSEAEISELMSLYERLKY